MAYQIRPRNSSPRNTTADQFIFSRVTGRADGKKEKRIVMVKKQMEQMLTTIPNRPRVQGPYGTFSFLIFLITRRTIAISYDAKRPAVVSEIMALNAAVDPTLMTQIKPVISVQRRTARIGRPEPGLTYR